MSSEYEASMYLFMFEILSFNIIYLILLPRFLVSNQVAG